MIPLNYYTGTLQLSQPLYDPNDVSQMQAHLASLDFMTNMSL